MEIRNNCDATATKVVGEGGVSKDKSGEGDKDKNMCPLEHTGFHSAIED